MGEGVQFGADIVLHVGGHRRLRRRCRNLPGQIINAALVVFHGHGRAARSLDQRQPLRRNRSFLRLPASCLDVRVPTRDACTRGLRLQRCVARLDQGGPALLNAGALRLQGGSALLRRLLHNQRIAHLALPVVVHHNRTGDNHQDVRQQPNRDDRSPAPAARAAQGELHRQPDHAQHDDRRGGGQQAYQHRDVCGEGEVPGVLRRLAGAKPRFPVPIDMAGRLDAEQDGPVPFHCGRAQRCRHRHVQQPKAAVSVKLVGRVVLVRFRLRDPLAARVPPVLNFLKHQPPSNPSTPIRRPRIAPAKTSATANTTISRIVRLTPPCCC